MHEVFSESTAPQVNVSVHGMADTERSERLAHLVFGAVHGAGKLYDLSTLDGITISFDYNNTLASLDRGYETSYKLQPTSGETIGVAMTPSVKREGKIKSHIVINGIYVLALENENIDLFHEALYIVAHECAHVEVTAATQRCLPNYVMTPIHFNTKLDELVANASLWCWDEYAACRLSAIFARPSTVESYVETFLGVLKDVEVSVSGIIKDYRIHGDVDLLLSQSFDFYSRFARYASYMIGTMDGGVSTESSEENITRFMQNHWSQSFLAELRSIYTDLFSVYGKWDSVDQLNRVGRLVAELLPFSGIIIEELSDGRLHLRVPFNPATLPSADEESEIRRRLGLQAP